MSELEPMYCQRGELLADIRALIAEARRQTTVAVNIGLTLPYWRTGQRIHREGLGRERAAFGRTDYRDGVTTIELVLLQRPFAPQSALPTGILRGDGPDRRLERAYSHIDSML